MEERGRGGRGGSGMGAGGVVAQASERSANAQGRGFIIRDTPGRRSNGPGDIPGRTGETSG